MHPAEAPAFHPQTSLPPPAPRGRTCWSEPYLVVHICDVHAVEDVVPEVVTQHPPQDVEGDVGPGVWGHTCPTACRPPHSPAHCAWPRGPGEGLHGPATSQLLPRAGAGSAMGPGLLHTWVSATAAWWGTKACGSKHRRAAQDTGHGATGQRAHGPCVLSNYSIVYVNYLLNGDVYLKSRRSQKGRDALGPTPPDPRGPPARAGCPAAAPTWRAPCETRRRRWARSSTTSPSSRAEARTRPVFKMENDDRQPQQRRRAGAQPATEGAAGLQKLNRNSPVPRTGITDAR